MIPHAIPGTPFEAHAAHAARRNKSRTTRRHSRSELLQLVATMAVELEARAGSPGLSRQARVSTHDSDMLACLRAARHLREVLSIAEGRKSAAYWQRKSGA